MVTIQKYIRPRTLDEAWELNQKRRNRIVGGMLWLKMSRASIDTAIDLSGLGLDQIEETEDAFFIGAMTTLRQLECHRGLAAYTGGVFSDVLGGIVGVQFRNLATVGGSVWGRFGFSDILTALLCMDTEVELYKGGMIPLSRFVDMPYDRDILVRIIIRKTPCRIAYRSMRQQKTDFALLNCAAACCDHEVRVAVGARPNKAVLLRFPAEATDDSAELARNVSEQVETGTNSRGSSAYRKKLAFVLCRGCIDQLKEGK